MAITTDTYLRRAEREDLDVVVEWMEDPDFMYFLYGDPARSPKRIREQIVSMLGRSAGNALPGGLYFITDSPKHGPIGLVALQNISWRNRSCSVDAYVGNKKMRAGLAGGVSVFRAVEYAFHELNMHRVGMYVYAFNTASWRMVERLGAVRELTLKDHVARDGELYDMYGYGLLRPEFEAVHKEIAERNPGLLLEASKEAEARGRREKAEQEA